MAVLTAWDKTKPQAGIAAQLLDDYVRENFAYLEAAVDQDHDFTTGGTQTGKHNKVSLIEAADIGTGAEGLPVLGAQTASGKAELVFTDEDDNDVQITSGGVIPCSSTDMLDEDDMASDDATKAPSQQSVKAYVDSGEVTMTNKTLTSPVINEDVSGTAVLDEDDFASDSDTQIATQQSIKAYVDAAIESIMPQAPTNNDHAGNALAGTSIYYAETYGLLCFHTVGYINTTTIKVGLANPPTTTVARGGDGSGYGNCITTIVPKDYYVQVTGVPAAYTITWTAFGSGDLVKQ